MMKVLSILVGGGLALVILLAFSFMVMTSVGYLNFFFFGEEIRTVAALAGDLPLKPGEGHGVELEGDRLVKRQFADVKVHRDGEGRLFLRFNRGGGHLGSQGYIYSEDPNYDVPNGPISPLAESNEYKHVAEHWWSYDSTED